MKQKKIIYHHGQKDNNGEHVYHHTQNGSMKNNNINAKKSSTHLEEGYITFGDEDSPEKVMHHKRQHHAKRGLGANPKRQVSVDQLEREGLKKPFTAAKK